MIPISLNKLSTLRIFIFGMQFKITYKLNMKRQTTTSEPLTNPKRSSSSTFTGVGYLFFAYFLKFKDRNSTLFIENYTLPSRYKPKKIIFIFKQNFIIYTQT